MTFDKELPENILSTAALRHNAGTFFAYKHNLLIRKMMPPRVFWGLMPAIVESLETKPALTELTKFPEIQAAICLMFMAFSGETRERSAEPLPEHSMRVAQGVASILKCANVPEIKAMKSAVKGILHDVPEDSNRIYAAYIPRLFGFSIHLGVNRLTIPNDLAMLRRIYEQLALMHPYLPKEPANADLKFAYKYYYQAGRLQEDEPVIKAVDTIDKPGSDSADFLIGDDMLGAGEYRTVADIVEKNEARAKYIDLYTRSLYEQKCVNYFGADAVAIIAREIRRMFDQAANAMVINATHKPAAPVNKYGTFHLRRGTLARSSVFSKRGHAVGSLRR